MKKLLFSLFVTFLCGVSYAQDSVTVYQGANTYNFLLSDIDSITHSRNNTVSIYHNSQKNGYSVMKVDSVSFVKALLTPKKGTAAIIMNAHDPEIVQITAEDGSVFHFYGTKEENGLPDSITYAEIVSPNGELSMMQFGPDGRISSFTASNNVEISFDWVGAEEAVVKVYNPEDNTYIVTNWNLNGIPSSARRLASGIQMTRTGISVMSQIPMVYKSAMLKADANNGSRDFDVRIRKCDSPSNAKVFLRLFEGGTAFDGVSTKGYITTIYNYQYVTQGWYSFRIPDMAFSTSMPNKEMIDRIDERLMPILQGIGMFAEGGAITTTLVATILAFVPGGLLSEPIMLALIGMEHGVALTATFLSNTGLGWFARTFDPEWYYKKEYNSMFVVPYVNGKPYQEDGCTIEYDYGDWGTVVELDGTPEIRSFDLSPKFPSAGQGYRASVSYRCIPKGSKIVMGIVGTDGYKNETTQTAAAESGYANLDVPGAATGVHDVCTVTIYDTSGNPIASTQASLTFGN